MFVVGNIDVEVVVVFVPENKLVPTLLIPLVVIPVTDVFVLEPNTGIAVVFAVPTVDPPVTFVKIGIEFVDANPIAVVLTLDPKTDVVVVFFGMVKVVVVVFKLEDVAPNTGRLVVVVAAPNIEKVDGELVNMEPVFETN